MAWIKVDGRFFMGPTVLTAGPVGGLMYLYGLTYCMDHNLDVFPRVVVEKLWGRQYGDAVVADAVAALVRAGVWVEADHGDGFPGWTIVHEWVEEDVVIEVPGEWGTADYVAHARSRADACVHCGATDRLEVDHIVPRSRGGCSRPSNLQILCKTCNVKKRSTVPWGALGGGRPDGA